MGSTLLEKAFNGDKKAFKKLIIENSEFIYRLAFIHTKYEEDAKNIMSKTVIYMEDNINKLSKYDSFKKFMIKVTIKHINEYLDEMGMVEDENNDDYVDENGYIDMYKGIDLLDIHSKNVVILVYFYNMSYEDVADILNMNESTVKLYLRNSLKFIKNNINSASKMTKENLDNNILNNLDLDEIEIETNLDRYIERYIKEFYIDSKALELISIPENLENSAESPLKKIKNEKIKNIPYIILDIFLVCIILLPIIGTFYPKVFAKVPKVHNVFENINEFIQLDNLKSFVGIGKEVVEGSGSSSVETIYIEEKDVVKPKNNNEAIKLIHSLANTLIEADYKWQCTEVTPKTISIALEGVEEIKDDYDRMHLRNALTKWKNGDFSNAVNVHNYVWEMLDGTIGKAEKLDTDEIQNILDEYY